MSRGVRGAYGTAPKVADTLGKRIRRVRLAWKWSQKQLAEAISANPKTLSRWELDRQDPAEPALGALASLFGLSVDALRTGRQFRVPDPPRRVGGVLLAESVAAELVRLPTLPKPGLVLVQRESGDASVLPSKSVNEVISRARRAGKRVWVVVG